MPDHVKKALSKLINSVMHFIVPCNPVPEAHANH